MKEQDKEFIEKWESLIETVDKTDIPLEFVNSIDLEFHEGTETPTDQIINIQLLRKRGYDDLLIEDIVEQTLKEYGRDIRSLSFLLDVEYVAASVQEQTDKLLVNI